MGASVMPNEILENILKNLTGKDAVKIRRVCRRWKGVVDGFNEDYWKKTCKKEYSDVCKDAFRKSCLSWRELYKSLTLWSHVSTADVRVRKTPARKTNTFQTLRNGVISYPIRTNEENPQDRYDTIIYYDLASEEEVDRQTFEFSFKLYKENDNFIVLDHYDNINEYNNMHSHSIHVIAKDNREQFHQAVVDYVQRLVLIEKEVYYQTRDRLTRVKLIEKNKAVSIETTDFVGFNHQMKEIGYIDGGRVNIFTSSGLILALVDKELSVVTTFDIIADNAETPTDIIKQLKELGFSWSCATILGHMYSRIHFVGTYVVEIIHTYDKIIVTGSGTPRRMIHIYFDPYGPNGELIIGSCTPQRVIHINFNPNALNSEQNLFDTKPDKTIDLDEYRVDTSPPWRIEIRQIDIVESENGHKVIVLFCNKIYVIELVHESRRKRVMSV